MAKNVKLDGSLKQVLELTTASMNKKGRIKISGDKKGTKALRNSCVHHKLTKGGNMKMTLSGSTEKGYSHCRMCKRDVRITPYAEDELNDLIDKSFEFLDHAAYIMTSVKAGDSAIRSAIQAKVAVKNLKKVYERTIEVVEKTRGKGKGKKKGKNKKRDITLTAWSSSRF